RTSRRSSAGSTEVQPSVEFPAGGLKPALGACRHFSDARAQARATTRTTMSRSLSTLPCRAANSGRRQRGILKGDRFAVDPAGVATRLIDRGREQHGFTLIEVLVSALIVTLIAGAVAGGLMANVKATGDQHRRTEAQALAEQDQERLKGLSAAQLDNLSQTYTTTQDKNKFTVSSQAWYLSTTGGVACS